MRKSVESAFRAIVLEHRVLAAQRDFVADEQHSGNSIDTMKCAFGTIRPATAVDYARLPEFVAFKERIWAAAEDGPMPTIGHDGSFAAVADEVAEFSVTSQRQRLICPITQQSFVEPVRSYTIVLHTLLGRAVSMSTRSRQSSRCCTGAGTSRARWPGAITMCP